uniref:Dipeptidyl-peptidase 10 (Non-functional) n=1 Tax=Oryzias latipes TaxID=8090 RepID=A0A3P9JVI7_ORYLA
VLLLELRLSHVDGIEVDIGPIGPDRNWKGIGISLLVILVVLSFIGLSIVLLSKGEATFKASKFAISPDLNFVLLGYDVKQVHQHSFLASYLIYNLHTREVQELNPPEVPNSVLQFASWGVHGQQLVYIFENNIYYKANVQSSSWRLTSSGQEGVVFNGITDWLYEVEVLHSQAAHWWSPDGSKLAYLTINDSLVPTMFLPRFTGSLYPQGKEYRYPKMGQTNPQVSLHIVTLDGSSLTEEIRPPDCFHQSERYITMVTWVAQEKLAVRWVNRAQTMSVLSLCDTTAGACTKEHVMVTDTWLDGQNQKPVFSRDSTAFFTIMPLKHSIHGAFNHVAMISNHTFSEDASLRHLTSGTWDVTQILSHDESTNSVFFLSTEEGPSQQHLYRISTVNSLDKECLSCSLFRSNCTYFDAAFSSDCQQVLLTCRGTGGHSTAFRFTARLPGVAHFNPFPDVKTEMKCAVSDRFSLGWESVLVSSERFIVARLDGRGSRSQGGRILHGVHKRLGTVDAQDQITALEHLMKLPYIDQSKAGIYGKAYGGFLSTILLLSHSSRFRCGIAVAPITDWRLYATVHFQHSAELVKLLSSLNVNYTLQVNIFPDEGYTLCRQSQDYMLSSVMYFFKRCFHEEKAVAKETSKEDD